MWPKWPRGSHKWESLPLTKISYYRMSNSVTYSSFDKSAANSLVYFCSDGFGHTAMMKLIPAKIRLIFQHYRKVGQMLACKIFVALHQFQAIQSEKDSFISYPDFHTKLYHKEPLPSVIVVRVGDVHCHANCQPWDALNCYAGHWQSEDGFLQIVTSQFTS